MDNLTKAQRRKNMQNIRSKNTAAEILLSRELRKNKLTFSRNVESIEGKPDIVFRRKKILIFVDSDFWHKHPKRFVMPKSNVKYWKQKIDFNAKRDKKISRLLAKSGWKVIRLWEFDIKRNLERCRRKILKALGEL